MEYFLPQLDQRRRNLVGGEPTVVVDRYPFGPGQYRDIAYYSAPLGVGFPGYSYFWKSDDLGKTWRLPPHDPVTQ